ncbi:hypothetical protein FXO38_29165 [Capsicum annuum]|nr:hypothetical protein FXO38_29165 [Capsicum annuum]
MDTPEAQRSGLPAEDHRKRSGAHWMGSTAGDSKTSFNWGYPGSRGAFNARFLVEKGLGIEVERNEEDGSFTRNEIEKALRYAMVSEEGEELRVRAKEAAAIFGDQKLHDSYVASLVEYLKNK